MKLLARGISCVCASIALVTYHANAQDLGRGFHKIKDGIYAFAPDASTTTCSFVVTQEGVVMIDSCNNPLDARRMLATIKAGRLGFENLARGKTLRRSNHVSRAIHPGVWQ